MKKILIAICALAVMAACHKDEPEEDKIKADRTVLVYISGENDLSDFIDSELIEMKTGSKTIGDNNLLIYVDRVGAKELPWLARIHKGLIKDSVSVKDMNIQPTDGFVKADPYASDPQVMEQVLRYAFNKYPSKESDFGLVLWGHASGWLISNDTIPYTAMARRKAYGIDNGQNTKSIWMNIPTMAKMLSKLPHLSFIFADCCNFQCLESAYELRHVTDYIIGSPAEIPGVGAPYNTVVPAMFEKTSFWQSIVDRYYEQRAEGFDVALSVIKTSEMENLTNATGIVLPSIKANINGKYPDMSGIIHYYYDQKYYDANHFVLKFAPTNEYTVWKQALDKAVIYKKMATKWLTIVPWSYYTDFEMTEENYGGVSIFVPQWSSASENDNIKKMGWYKAAHYEDIGW